MAGSRVMKVVTLFAGALVFPMIGTKEIVRADILPLDNPEAFVGRWIATGYYCRGTEPDQIVEISYSVWSGLTATKVTGDDCIGSGEVTWRNGKLEGQTIRTEFHARPLGASVWDDQWHSGSLHIISRDEITGFGVRYRRVCRTSDTKETGVPIDLSGLWSTRPATGKVVSHPGTIRITQQGADVTATWVDVPNYVPNR